MSTMPIGPADHPDRPLTVGDLMTTTVFAVSPRDPLDTAMEVMIDEGVRHLPVVDDEGSLVGIVSHRDVFAAGEMRVEFDTDGSLTELGRALADRLVQQVMAVPESVSPDTLLAEAAEIMLDTKYGCLPVVENRRLVGILTEGDFVRLALTG